MKILYITSVLGDIGGSEIYTRDLINGLLKKGHEVLVASTEPYDFKHKNAKVLKIPVFGHHGLHKFIAPLFYKRVVKAAKEFKPDVIQSHSNSFTAWIGDKVKKELKVPHVLLIEMISDRNENLHQKTIHFFEKTLLPRLKYDKIIVWTENMKEKFLIPWGIKEERIEVVPASINLENYDLNASGKRIVELHGKNLITTMKSMWHINLLGLIPIVKAMKYVKAKHPEYKYLCIGPGDTEKLKEIARHEGVEDVIVFTGPIKHEEKAEYWKATQIAPHSYLYEFSTSVSLLEYMAFGNACIVTDIGAVKEFVGDSALLVKPEDERDMARGIIELIENPEFRESLKKKARKRVEENFTIKKAVERLEETYRSLGLTV